MNTPQNPKPNELRDLSPYWRARLVMFAADSGNAVHIVGAGTTTVCGLSMAPATRFHSEEEKPVTCDRCKARA